MPENAEPLSLEYADAREAEGFAARGLVYVLGVIGGSNLLRLGWHYGDRWFSWTGMTYGGSRTVLDWVGNGTSMGVAGGSLLASLTALVCLAGRLRSPLLPRVAAAVISASAATGLSADVIGTLTQPAGNFPIGGGRAAYVVLSVAYAAVHTAVPATLLWLLTHRRFAAALAGNARSAV